MPEFKEVKISRILNPTAIDLGEYVINPFMGCEFNCLYCYVRYNKVVSRKKEAWGTYVDIRTNAPELLEKEIAKKRPSTVLLGSTTEIFQPIEAKYKLTKRILEILNKHRIYYNILTRSPLAAEYSSILAKGFCKRIYFTINNTPAVLKAKLEPKSPPYQARYKAIRQLFKEGVPVIPSFSPLLPWVSDFKKAFWDFPEANEVGFEGLNLRLGNAEEVINAITSIYPQLKSGYKRLLVDRAFYDAFWSKVKKEIVKEAIKTKKNYDVYIHSFGRISPT